MALLDNLTTEKQKLTALLEAEYPVQNLRDNPLIRLFIIRFLLGELVGSGGGDNVGDASAANQTSVQSNVGAIPTKVIGVQGVVGGVSVPVVFGGSLPAGTNAIGSITNTGFAINGTLPAFAVTPTVNIGTAPNLQPTTYTISTLCLIDPLVERSIELVGVSKIAINSRTNSPFRLSPLANGTINTQNFESVNAGIEWFQDGVNFTGSLFISSDVIPTAFTVPSCQITNGSFTVVALNTNAFAAVAIGQSVGGSGIPANTFVIGKSANNQSIRLGDANGNTVAATATVQATLTFAGAVIRVSTWK